MIKVNFRRSKPINDFFYGIKQKVKRLFDKHAQDSLKKVGEIYLEECKRLTPEDTKHLLNSYKVTRVEKKKDGYYITITNDADYFIYVEYGVQGLTYNYHKPKGSVFYTGVGNRTLARALDNKRDEMLSILSNI